MKAPNREIIMILFLPKRSERSPSIGEEKNIAIKTIACAAPKRKYRVLVVTSEESMLSRELIKRSGSKGPSNVPLKVSINITINKGRIRKNNE